MKTNKRIDLVYDHIRKEYNPVTGQLEKRGALRIITVPCFLNFVSKAQLMQEYGTTNQRVMIVRFSKGVEPFSYALYEGDRYELEDGKDIPIKGAVRLKRVQA